MSQYLVINTFLIALMRGKDIPILLYRDKHHTLCRVEDYLLQAVYSSVGHMLIVREGRVRFAENLMNPAQP